MQPSDLDARRMALDPTRSFICEAPAGSGKTELLTQRILTLLSRVETPEAVLAITFTRKAAAEMRHRVLEALRLAQAEAPADAHKRQTWELAKRVLERDAQAGWQLLSSPTRLQIKTFDSLARRLMQSLPLHTGLDATWAPADDVDLLYQQAARDLLDTLDQKVTWSPSLERLFRHLDNRYQDIEQLLVSMLKRRDAWMNVLSAQPAEQFKQLLERFLDVAITDRVKELHALLGQSDCAELLDLARFAGNNLVRADASSGLVGLAELDSQSLPGADAAGVSQWRLLAAWLLTGEGKWRQRVNKNQGFPAGEKSEAAFYKQQKARVTSCLQALAQVPGLHNALRDIEHWPAAQFGQEQWPVLEALLQLLPIAVVHLRWVFQQHQLLDFTEVSQQARQALGEEDAPTDLMQRLDYSIAHILVDEFQDTSFTQIELLKKLTYGWQPDDGRTLFCVGDAMQSIYSFRGANVGLFLFAQQRGLGHIPLEPVRLTTNFRSQAKLVEWVNNSFIQAFPQRLDITSGAVPFAKAEAFRAPVKAAVSTHIFDLEAGAAAGAWLVEEVRELRQRHPDWRIGILVKAKAHAQMITESLREAGMAFRAQDLVGLAERDSVRDALCLTYALLDPGDRISWLALLRAPWCGLTLSDLHALTSPSGKTKTVFEQMQALLQTPADACGASSQPLFSEDGRQRLQRVYRVLSDARESRERKPFAVWVEGAWQALGGDCLLENDEERENLERYWHFLDALSQQAPPDKVTLARRIATLHAAPNPQADDKLQIMTIHKSKGLEFDVVFLPDLHRKPRNTDRELLLWQERLSHQGEDTLLLAPINAKGEDKDLIYQHLLNEKTKKDRLEQCRLLYVACTRARERLYLIASLKPATADDQRWQPPAASSLLHHIWPAVATTAEAMNGEAEPAASVARDDEFSPPLLKRVTGTWCPPQKPARHLLEAFVPPYAFANQELPTPALDEDPFARIVGTLVHEMAARVGETGWPNSFEPWVAAWQSRLAAAGLAKARWTQALAEVIDCLERLRESPHFQWLLAQPHKRFEYPIRMQQGAECFTFVLDVLVVDAQGVAWIVDYKTATPQPGETAAGFVRRETALYRAPLDRYREAVSALGYDKVKAALLFIRTGQWQELR